jgi:hypothetical protein
MAVKIPWSRDLESPQKRCNMDICTLRVLAEKVSSLQLA